MRLLPDEQQIKKVMKKRRAELFSGVIFCVIAGLIVIVSVSYLALGRSFSVFCALCALAAVLVAHVPNKVKRASQGLEGLVAADTYICLENGLFAARDVYKNSYEGCIFVTDRISEVIEAKGEYPRFFVRSKDVSEDSCIFSDDSMTDETLFLVDGKKYDRDAFIGMYETLIKQLPEDAKVIGYVEGHPGWGRLRHPVKNLLSVVVVIAAFIVPELLYGAGILML